jgi:hypothetical protein
MLDMQMTFWTLRHYVASWLIGTGMRVMPTGRYRNELSAALWALCLKVQATVAAERAKRI